MMVYFGSCPIEPRAGVDDEQVVMVYEYTSKGTKARRDKSVIRTKCSLPSLSWVMFVLLCQNLFFCSTTDGSRVVSTMCVRESALSENILVSQILLLFARLFSWTTGGIICAEHDIPRLTRLASSSSSSIHNDQMDRPEGTLKTSRVSAPLFSEPGNRPQDKYVLLLPTLDDFSSFSLAQKPLFLRPSFR